jgi:cellulose synthase/poly-beta-1,6-N-acetylglucosamine synthase-like glycosyltransferase
MSHLGTYLLAGGAVWLLYVYAGYPACLWILGKFRSIHHVTDEHYLPKVSVLIAARNEQNDICWKIEQTLSWDYPRDRLQVLVASDASDDKTDEILKRIRDSRLTYIRIKRQGGKVRALNRLAGVATGELLFFTDANSNIAPNALRKIVRHFADPRVGCVTGADQTATTKEECTGKKQAIAVGETAYWSYELLIDELESRLGSVLVCFGAIHCVRRELYAACDPDLANDLEVPIRIGGNGHLVVFEPGAVSFEKATSSPFEEFRRRRRICGQGALAMYRLRGCLGGIRAWQFLSRKFLRWLGILPLVAMLAGSSLLASQSLVVSALLACQLICYALATFGLIASARGKKVQRFIAIPFYLMLVNVAAVMGVWDACCGRRYSTWSVASKTRSSEPLVKQFSAHAGVQEAEVRRVVGSST